MPLPVSAPRDFLARGIHSFLARCINNSEGAGLAFLDQGRDRY
jgi:hypothetical protein